jgi:hypothetical protein
MSELVRNVFEQVRGFEAWLGAPGYSEVHVSSAASLRLFVLGYDFPAYACHA